MMKWLHSDIGSQDFYETSEAYIVTLTLPGITPQDLDEITVQKNILTVRGYQPDAGAFCRSLRFTHPVVPDKIKVDLHNAVLTICVPKQGDEELAREA